MSAPVVTPTISANFTQPAAGSDVRVSLTHIDTITRGDSVLVAGGGYYVVMAVPDAYTLVLQNLGVVDNVTAATVVASGAVVTHLADTFPVPYWGGRGPTGAGFSGLTSATSNVAIGTGAKTLVTNLASTVTGFAVGTRTRATDASNVANFIEGVITAFSGTSLTINSDTTGGSGTPASWTLAATGATGATGLGYSGLTSATNNVAIGTGAKTLVTNLASTATAFAVGDRVRAIDASNAANYMEGVVASFAGTSLGITSDYTGGAGTPASWTISLAGAVGATGATGAIGLGYSGLTSATNNVVIGTGAKTLVTNLASTATAFAVGDRVRAIDAGDAGNYMEGVVASFAGTSLGITSDYTGGAGTPASWTISLAGAVGATGATGGAGSSGLGYSGLTSATNNVAIGTGAKTLVTNLASTATAFAVGDRVRAIDAGNAANYMEGVVASFAGTSLGITSDYTGGAGTPASWTISLTGAVGATGATGGAGSNGLGYSGLTSATNDVAIGTGAKSLTTNLASTATAFAVGARIRATDAGNSANYMEGVITSFSGTALAFLSDKTGGSGTPASWTIAIAGDVGATGAAGAAGAAGGELTVYNSGTTYNSGDKVWYNGLAFQSTTTQSNVAPQAYLFYDRFVGYPDGMVVGAGAASYNSTNLFTGLGTFTSAGATIATSSGVTTITAAASNYGVTFDPGAVGMVLDVAFGTIPAAASGNPYIAVKLDGVNGVFVFTTGGTATASPTLATFGTTSAGNNVATGNNPANLTLALSSSGGTYTPPVTGDTMRITRDAGGKIITLQILAGGVTGGPIITFTNSGSAVWHTTTTTVSLGLGSGGSFSVTSLKAYSAVPGASTWTELTQPFTRTSVAASAITFHGRYGRFFYAIVPSLNAGNGTLVTWTNTHITPEAHVNLYVSNGGYTATTVEIRAQIVSVGWGRCLFQLFNGGSAAFTGANVTLCFRIDYPLSTTALNG